DAERQALKHLVDKLDGRALGARVKHLQDANSGAIVDGRELIQPSSRARDALEKLDVQLQPVARLRLFVSLPPLAVWPMRLIGRQPIQPRRVRMLCTDDRAIVTR